MADAGDLKSPVLWACGFESRLQHQNLSLSVVNQRLEIFFICNWNNISALRALGLQVYLNTTSYDKNACFGNANVWTRRNKPVRTTNPRSNFE